MKNKPIFKIILLFLPPFLIIYPLFFSSDRNYSQKYFRFINGSQIASSLEPPTSKITDEFRFPSFESDNDTIMFADFFKISPVMLDELSKFKMCYSLNQFYDLNNKEIPQIDDRIHFEITQGTTKTLIKPNEDPQCFDSESGDLLYYLHPEVTFSNKKIIDAIEKYGKYESGKKILQSRMQIELIRKFKNSNAVFFVSFLITVFWCSLVLLCHSLLNFIKGKK